MPQSYTLEQLAQMGAKPRSYTIEELTQMGAKPSEAPPSPIAATPTAASLPYKRETARLAFEGAKPVPTAMTGLQNLGESVVGGLGDIVKGTAGLFKAGLTGNAMQLGETAVNLPGGVKTALADRPADYVEALVKHDPDAAARAGGRILTDTVPTAYGALTGVPKALRAAPEALRAVTTPDRIVKAAANLREMPPPANLSRFGAVGVVGAGAAQLLGYPWMEGAALSEIVDMVRRNPTLRSGLASKLEKFAASAPSDQPLALSTAAADEASRIGQLSRNPLPKEPLSAPEKLGIERPKPPQFISEDLGRLTKLSEDSAAAADEAARMRELAQNPLAKEPFMPPEKVNIERPKPPSIPTEQPLRNSFQDIEEIIAPSGRNAKRATILFNADGTPTPFGQRLIQEVPDLKTVSKGPQADAAIVKNFKRTERGVIDAEAAVPREVTVDKAPIVEELKTLAKEYGENRGMLGTAAKLNSILNVWEKAPAQVPWEQFVKLKRGFFQERNITSGPLRRAYGKLIEASNAVSEDLARANSSYSTVRRAMDNAQIDLSSGRRIMPVGKAGVDTGVTVYPSNEPPLAPLSAQRPLPMRPAPKPQTVKEAFERFRSGGTAKRVGAGIGQESELGQSVDAYLKNFSEEIRGGNTEMTGKALGRERGPISANYGTEQSRTAGGYNHELSLATGDSPGVIAEAIKRHMEKPNASNVVYDRARKAAFQLLSGDVGSRSEIGNVRHAARSQVEEALRQRRK